MPRIRGLAASAGVRLRANETEISAAPRALMLGKGLYFTFYVAFGIMSPNSVGNRSLALRFERNVLRQKVWMRNSIAFFSSLTDQNGQYYFLVTVALSRIPSLQPLLRLKVRLFVCRLYSLQRMYCGYTVRPSAKVTIMTDYRKSHMKNRLVPK